MSRTSDHHQGDSDFSILEEFLDRVSEERWVDPQRLQALRSAKPDSPGIVFKPGTHRPLTAAFFGGTGVGKSTLLNRLAGAEIAKTGILRPTSTEISLFLHESIAIDQLPNDLPLSTVRMGRHDNDSLRQILWIDMPDIDSVDVSNRMLALEWLPYIDVVIYVVSPERYQDDQGFELLHRHRGEHAWIFVMNQWDRGVDVQFDAFASLIRNAGFVDPVMFKTDSRASIHDHEDDLLLLQELLQEISHKHLLSQVQMNARLFQLEGMLRQLKELHASLASETSYESLMDAWESIWSETERDLFEGLEWPLRSIVATLLGGVGSDQNRTVIPAKELTQQGSEPTRGNALELISASGPVLWDPWAQGRTEDALMQLMVRAGERGLAVWPLKNRLLGFSDEVGSRVEKRSQLRLRQALATPGNAMQRVMMQMAGIFSIVLPVLALGWASYHVVTGYYQSALNHAEYLGTDFAIHTILLIALAWGVPWFIYLRLKPSVENSARKGLREGIREALSSGSEQMGVRLAKTEQSHREISSQAKYLEQLLEGRISESTVIEKSPIVERLIGNP